MPDSSDKPGERASQSGQRWGDADLRPPTSARPVRREPKTKLALGAPPPPAGVPLELPADEVDAVAGLFASDRTVPAPGINDAPSEAEIGRWVATAQNSMFDDRVKDPAPVAMAPPAPAGRGSEPQRRPSAPKLPAIAFDADAEPPLGMSEPEAVPSRKPRAPAPPPPASPVPVQAKRTGSGARKKSPVAQPKPAEPEDQDEDLQLKPRKRRLEHGPSKTLLISVGAAALLSLGAATVLIGVLPNPFAPEPPARKACTCEGGGDEARARCGRSAGQDARVSRRRRGDRQGRAAEGRAGSAGRGRRASKACGGCSGACEAGGGREAGGCAT